ncbi:MAG TPA: LuxR C-terminal-related transcriptional regulator [Candidatus Binatia bacterium]|jgi:DNA-binding NarL/FixJ family response regulator|nr:LuxR C-terminal-related transcriptional regulator [Candidatus Binatia bacterium]
MSAAKTLEAILTAAEERVLTLVSQSMTNREIASRLGVSPATVKRHVENILRKLKVRNRVEAAIYSLSMAGCPARSSAECPLAAWRKRRDSQREKWAD